MFNLKNIKNIAIFLTVFLIIGFSCSKKSDEVSNKDTADNTEAVKVNPEDLNETDEDLLTVDYKEFYDELAPHGEWIEVTPDIIDHEMKKGTSSGEQEHRKITLSELFGVKDAYAYDASFGAFFAWQPSPGLAVTVTEGEPQPVYVPYTNGQWVYTDDAGWYFKAPTPYEEVVHHYGRWILSPTMGWVWIPGRVWAPAWVDWRENDEYIAWTPIPPSVYIVNDVVVVPPIVQENYVVVENRYFYEPAVYQYIVKEKKNKFVITEWSRPEGITVVNHTIINRGPDVKVIETTTGTHIMAYSIQKVKSIKDVRYTDKELRVYSPEFKKYKTKGNISSPVVKPQKFITYDQGRGKNNRKESSGNKNGSLDQNKNQDNEKNYKGNDNKNKGNEFKQENKNNKNSGINNSGKNKNKGDNNYKGNDNKNKGNDNNKKRNDNNYKGNDNKNKGNDNKFKGNDKSGSNQNKGKQNEYRNKNDNSKSRDNSNSRDKGNHSKGKK